MITGYGSFPLILFQLDELVLPIYIHIDLVLSYFFGLILSYHDGWEIILIYLVLTWCFRVFFRLSCGPPLLISLLFLWLPNAAFEVSSLLNRSQAVPISHFIRRTNFGIGCKADDLLLYFRIVLFGRGRRILYLYDWQWWIIVNLRLWFFFYRRFLVFHSFGIESIQRFLNFDYCCGRIIDTLRCFWSLFGLHLTIRFFNDGLVIDITKFILDYLDSSYGLIDARNLSCITIRLF